MPAGLERVRSSGCFEDSTPGAGSRRPGSTLHKTAKPTRSHPLYRFGSRRTESPDGGRIRIASLQPSLPARHIILQRVPEPALRLHSSGWRGSRYRSKLSAGSTRTPDSAGSTKRHNTSSQNLDRLSNSSSSAWRGRSHRAHRHSTRFGGSIPGRPSIGSSLTPPPVGS